MDRVDLLKVAHCLMPFPHCIHMLPKGIHYSLFVLISVRIRKTTPGGTQTFRNAIPYLSASLI